MLIDSSKRKRYDDTGEYGNGPSETEMAIVALTEIFMRECEANNFKKANYFKRVRKSLSTAVSSANSEISAKKRNLKGMDYILENSSFGSDSFSSKLILKRQAMVDSIAAIEVTISRTKLCIKILDSSKYTGEEEDISLDDLLRSSRFSGFDSGGLRF